MSPRALTVAIVQAEVAPTLAESLERTRALASDAAADGASVIAFPETWIPGYPAWLDCCRDAALWDHPPVKAVYRRMAEHAVVVDGTSGTRLREIARDVRSTLVVGIVERVDHGPGHGTLYNSLLTIGADGTLLNHHRKLMPTYTERLVWGTGDADGLRAVAAPIDHDRGARTNGAATNGDPANGVAATGPGSNGDASGGIASDGGSVRIGGLICWEHWMPLARQALHESAEDVHVAVWPTVHERHQIASRHYALEGRCFVLACGGLMRASALPAELEPHPDRVHGPDDWVLRGGSAIIGPDGDYVTQPVFDQAAIVMAELDAARIREESMTLDVSGHYHRPDLLHFQVDRSSRTRI